MNDHSDRDSFFKLLRDLRDLDHWVHQRGWKRVSEKTFGQLYDRVQALAKIDAEAAAPGEIPAAWLYEHFYLGEWRKAVEFTKLDHTYRYPDGKFVKGKPLYVHPTLYAGATEPQDAVYPEAYMNNTGSICIDWDDDPSNQLSIVANDGRVTFAAYYCGKKVHGAASGPEFLAALRRFAGEVENAARDIKPDGFDAIQIAECQDLEQLRNWAGCMRRERDNWRQYALALTEQPACDREDAARYRWLRDKFDPSVDDTILWLSGEKFDSAIDDELNKEK